MSLSARRAWIEIGVCSVSPGCRLSLSARRAWIEILLSGHLRSIPQVALRKESVDRNITVEGEWIPKAVALRKESVDRNNAVNKVLDKVAPSLSARRAWIEMSMPRGRSQKKPSLSARRAWIEIRWLLPADRRKHVALRKESVDRNLKMQQRLIGGGRRSPQGERG